MFNIKNKNTALMFCHIRFTSSWYYFKEVLIRSRNHSRNLTGIGKSYLFVIAYYVVIKTK